MGKNMEYGNSVKAVPAKLACFFEEHPRVALAFSGGCDSAYLLYAAKACGAEICAYSVKTCFQPEFELRDALRLAEELGCEMRVLELDVLSDENVRRNPADRCYFCKRRIFETIRAAACQDGYACLMDGTNASDDALDRPGMRALCELEVRSPLREAGITKAQLRNLSREAGLFTWNKPAYACLATRIPGGTEIHPAMLAKIERAEAELAALGFSDFRARMAGGGVRLELTEAQMPMLLQKRGEVLCALEAYFDEISLNLRPRKGWNYEHTGDAGSAARGARRRRQPGGNACAAEDAAL